MQQQRSYVGPRGWAVLTLVSGVALASPFLRPPSVDVEEATPPAPAAHTSGLARLASLEFSAADSSGLGRAASERSLYELTDLSQQLASPVAASPSELPAWAPVHSPIDQLIAQGTAPPWQADSKKGSTLKPLTPWINDPSLGQPPAVTAAAPTDIAHRVWPEASSLPAADRSRPARSESVTFGDIASANGSSPGILAGSLTGTSQTLRAATTPRLRPPEPSVAPPERRRFVYQPGFNAPAP